MRVVVVVVDLEPGNISSSVFILLPPFVSVKTGPLFTDCYVFRLLPPFVSV